MCKEEQSVGDDGSTLALKPSAHGQSQPKSKTEIAVALQNGDLSLQKNLKK